MKRTFLLIFTVVIAVSFQRVNAQKLLVSEEFSSAAWQAEFLRLNPGSTDGTSATLINPNAPNVLAWATRSPADGTYGAYLYGSMNSTDLYFGKYKLGGNTETINGTVPTNKTCAADGGNHNVTISEGVKVGLEFPMGFRLYKGSEATGTGYFEFPKIANAGRIYMHVLCGNNTTASELVIQKLVDGTWTTINTKTIKKRNDIEATAKVDEVLNYYVDSRDSVKLRIAHTSTKPYVLLFETSIEEHPSLELKQRIDSAVAIRTANAENIGSAIGQYSQEVYDSLGVVIDSINTVYNDLTKGRAALLTATTDMENAITYFNANVNDIGTGISPLLSSSFKQFGRKLVINKPATISIYNAVGTLVYQQDQVQVMEIPAYVGKGVFIVKSGPGVQKIYLGE